MTLDVPKSLWRGQRLDDSTAVDGAVVMLAQLADVVGVSDLGASSVLDVGCGVKFSQAFLNRGVPIGRYVGIDVESSITEFLDGAVTDPRFAYRHFDAANDRYNPGGTPMSALTELPLDGEQFDVICLYSVFTHLDPTDYVAMLRLLRPHAAPNGVLAYSAFLDERTPGGHGLIDKFAASLGDDVVGQTATFRDIDPDRPLYQALFSQQYAIDLIEGTGWTLDRIEDPTEFVQHLVVCRPA